MRNFGGHAFYSVHLKPLSCWDHGFESCGGSESSSRVLCDELITRSGET
jgi:hypothetical protein